MRGIGDRNAESRAVSAVLYTVLAVVISTQPADAQLSLAWPLTVAWPGYGATRRCKQDGSRERPEAWADSWAPHQAIPVESGQAGTASYDGTMTR